MKYWTEYIYHSYKVEGKRKKIDNTIYTFDIESTSYIKLHNKIYNMLKYDELIEDEKEECEKKCLMYIWTLSIDEEVFYGRTWVEFYNFLELIDDIDREVKKIIFVHNLSFEFQFLKSYFNIKDVFARKAHKVIKCMLEDFNIEFRCSCIMSNCALDKLTELYKLPVKKLKGNLDYNKIRTPITKMTNEELAYCENDCLVVYYYILEELKTYERVDKIPITSTGHVRKELRDIVMNDYSYRNKVRKSINVEPHVYNLLIDCFAGGFTHANWLYAGDIIKNVTSYDFTSSYPYVLVTHRYPSSEFKKCNLKRIEQLNKNFAYIIVVKFTNIRSKYFTSYISLSKCKNVSGGKYDNGRIIEAQELEITLTDIDFRLIFEMYNIEKYEIIESYYSTYNYLPKQFIEFILQKYVNKTKYKGIKEKELEYMKEKNKFNSLYGMSVTNTIRDNVIFNNETKNWEELELTNKDIENELQEEKKKAFLSFSYRSLGNSLRKK